MTDLCTACMTWHPLPKCGHNPDAPCARCGKPVGYLWTDEVQPPPGVCWFCVYGRGRA